MAKPWAAAAGALYWLAILAGFRILFELIYDYLVVVGMTGSIMSTQLCWLAALVPALLLGAQEAELKAVAMAQLLVVTAVVLPIYLWRLSVAGVGPWKVARQLSLPTVGLSATCCGSRSAVRWAAARLDCPPDRVHGNDGLLCQGFSGSGARTSPLCGLLGRRGGLDQH